MVQIYKQWGWYRVGEVNPLHVKTTPNYTGMIRMLLIGIDSKQHYALIVMKTNHPLKKHNTL